MSSLLKRAAADALVEVLRAKLPPSLGLDVESVAADPEEVNRFPSLRVLPGKFAFSDVFQEREVDDSNPTSLLLEVGDFAGTVELRVSAKTPSQRELIEDAVTNLFLAPELSPGVLTAQTKPVTVGGVATLYSATCTFSLEDVEWRDELAFSKKRYTFLELDAWYPALVLRQGVFTIQQLVLAFNEDLSSNVPEEQSQVNADGTLTRLA